MSAVLKLMRAPWDWIASSTPTNNGAHHVYVADNEGRKIAAIWGSNGERVNTARLVASAPELYEALQTLEQALNSDRRQKSIIGDEVEYHLDGGTMTLALNACRAALAKARGESQ